MCDALPYVAARLAVESGWWRAGTFGEWDPWNGSGVSFDVGGDEWGGICWFRQEAAGVTACVGGRGMRTGGKEKTVPVLRNDVASSQKKGKRVTNARRQRPRYHAAVARDRRTRSRRLNGVLEA